MLEFSQYCLIASSILVALAMVSYVVVLAMRRTVRQPALAHAGARGSGSTETPEGVRGVGATAKPTGLVWYGSRLTVLALLFLTAALVARTVATGHGPFSNQYEFAVSFAWGMLAAYIYFEWKYQVRMLALVVLPITEAILLYSETADAAASPLVPALQNNLLLTLHVVTAVVAYGAAAVACAAGVLYLIQPEGGRRGLPKPALLDEIGYRAVVVSFPMMTIMIILGAIWADIAWGTYWSWDPKETASLVTWLIYGAYLHARVVRGWRGRRSAWLLMLGFAAVLFTYFGNLFFGGMHAYA
ncbi:c-type cytochrome biogenesis protein CcsB [Micromonospora polyrhachis]|uniref:ABC-type transport system involved in cytochrome c biogenesis permease subunit n=1 Tax=Micromonospora polyrhachis TaxID=1282883 RepID=A0A7W7SNB2_9ACTN|nr:cytochrome c biogenesis protein CcsA [Micromonospora polyrhachis]MBB4957925.1 ABC-type transport system involved in cytochrome c biogenesis permease subunit [Micromonospora polyrhachis]